MGQIKKSDTGIEKIVQSNKYKIINTTDTNKAISHFHEFDPDYILCVGKIKQTNKGNYFLEL